MPQLRIYRLFISHAWRYSNEYNRMISLLVNTPNFSSHNYSVPRANPIDATSTYRLKKALCYQINPVHVVIILAGMYVAYSDWIQFEINHALRVGKPIIGVRPWGSERTPQAVVNAANELVGWNATSIVSAIRSWAL